MSVTSPDEARALVQAASSLSDEELTAIIERIEAEIEAKIGAPYADENTEITEVVIGGEADLFLKRRVGSVVSVTEYNSPFSDGEVLTEGEDYYVWGAEGRLERNGIWGARVDVAYIPADDRAAWKQVTIDLLRIDIERTAQFQEAVGGEYSYTAPKWDAERARILKRLRFTGV